MTAEIFQIIKLVGVDIRTTLFQYGKPISNHSRTSRQSQFQFKYFIHKTTKPRQTNVILSSDSRQPKYHYSPPKYRMDSCDQPTRSNQPRYQYVPPPQTPLYAYNPPCELTVLSQQSTPGNAARYSYEPPQVYNQSTSQMRQQYQYQPPPTEQPFNPQALPQPHQVQYRYTPPQTNQSIGSNQTNQNEIVPFDSEIMKLEVKFCAICQSDFERNESIRFLACLHSFHNNCINQWLAQKSECPVCKNRC